ncbi:MAG: biotin/lipoyl-containing protein [Lachnospiraceae bacterium]|nr:biotin/lipoyl-containing protein [Lachnospiraceae bacterium]
MKNYRITVNGNVYDVSVEELNGNVATVPVVQTSTPVAAPKVTKPVAASAPAGAVTITSPMPGKIISVKVSVGAAVKKGDILMILEAMKMENEIQAEYSGRVLSINVAEGEKVGIGTELVTIE